MRAWERGARPSWSQGAGHAALDFATSAGPMSVRWARLRGGNAEGHADGRYEHDHGRLARGVSVPRCRCLSGHDDALRWCAASTERDESATRRALVRMTLYQFAGKTHPVCTANIRGSDDAEAREAGIGRTGTRSARAGEGCRRSKIREANECRRKKPERGRTHRCWRCGGPGHRRGGLCRYR